MTVKELFESIDFEKMFESLKKDFDIFYYVLPSDMEESERLSKKYYEIALNEIMKLKSDKSCPITISVMKYIDELSDIEKEKYCFQTSALKEEEAKTFLSGKDEYLKKYDIIFRDWKETVNANVYQHSVDTYGKDVVAAGIIKEMTFFGCRYNDVNNKIKEETNILVEREKEIESGTVKTYTMEEVIEHLEETTGISFPIKTKEEEELERQNMKRIIEKNIAAEREFLRFL